MRALRGAAIAPRPLRSWRRSRFFPAVQAAELVEAEAEEGDESLRGAMIELVARAVGGEAVVVDAMRRGAPDDPHRSLVEAEGDLAVDGLRVLGVEGIDGMAQGRVPEAVVDELRVLLVEEGLGLERLAERGEALEVLVRRDERDGGRALVGLAALDADDAVFHQVDAPDAIVAGDLADLGDEPRGWQLLGVEADRQSLLEADAQVRRGVGSLLRRLGPGERLFRRLRVGILEDAALDRAAPEVLVDGEGTLLRRRHLDAVLPGVLERGVAGDVPLPLRSDDLEIGGEALHREVEADLIVALAGGAVRDGGRSVLAGRRDQVPRDEGPGERRRERIDALIERICLQRGEAEVACELVLRVHHLAGDGAGLAGAHCQVLLVLRLADIGVTSDDVVA